MSSNYLDSGEVRHASGVAIPGLGLGLFGMGPDGVPAVTEALRDGYRLLDTAPIYGNEHLARAAIAGCGVPRTELFVVSKVWNDDQGYDRTLRAFESTTAALGVDSLDLYLIHWPAPAQDRYLDTWRAMERLLADGRVRAIGVSNFEEEHLTRLLAAADVPPAVNQVELHPFLPQPALRAFHDRYGIVTMAWSPLGGHLPAARDALLSHPVITTIAAGYGRTPAQVVLRWHVQRGTVPIPKSVHSRRLAENRRIWDFALSAAELEAVDGLADGTRLGPRPAEFG